MTKIEKTQDFIIIVLEMALVIAKNTKKLKGVLKKKVKKVKTE